MKVPNTVSVVVIYCTLKNYFNFMFLLRSGLKSLDSLWIQNVEGATVIFSRKSKYSTRTGMVRTEGYSIYTVIVW